jgi:hypothetical protein
MCYERRRAEACVDESAHHALGPVSEEPGTLTQGAPVFPGSSRLGIEPKTPGWLVQDPTTRPIGDLIPTIGGSGAHPWRGCVCFFFGVRPLVDDDVIIIRILAARFARTVMVASFRL